MDREKLTELTNKLYRLTLLFPKKEPLRYRIREIADEVLVNYVSWENLNKSNPGSFVGEKERNQKGLIFSLENNLDILKSYFEVAKWQDWVSYFDILEIQDEYDKIKCDFEREIGKLEIKEKEEIKNIGNSEITFPQKETSEEQLSAGLGKEQDEETGLNSSARIGSGTEMNFRNEKILKILERVGRIQVGEMNKFFPDVSKRTLRRDFQNLVKQGLIKRIGEKNNTFYQLY